jgi:glycolate oxidase iron-sulfur subunit
MSADGGMARAPAARAPLEAARAGFSLCVHCGFCLQACPTYLALEDENDSPRGRIVLMRALADGSLPLDDPDARMHLDRCLGCRGCETACPSGVPYGHLLEAARESMSTVMPPPPVARAVLWVFARPAILAMVLAGARLLRATGLSWLLARLPGRIGFAMAMLESTRPPRREAPYTRRGTGARGSAALLRGCVMEGLFKFTNRATARTLRANDYALVDAPGQRCCGALHAHAGDAGQARALARANIAAFERSGADWIAVNAAGCGAMMKEYGALLAGDAEWSGRAAALSARVRDVSELLAAAGPAPGGPLPMRVAYDPPCHLLHAQRLTDPPLAVLRAIPGLVRVPLAGAELCCGAAGIYNLIEPEVSGSVLAPKVAYIGESGAEVVATGNPGCLMQIGAGLTRAGLPVRVAHPVDLLDASYAAAP